MVNNPTLARSLRLVMRAYRSFVNGGLTWARTIGRKHEVPRNNDSRKRILVATSVGGHLTCLNLETVLAQALARRGAQVTALLCDGVLPACMECEHRYYPTVRTQRSLLVHGPKGLCLSCTRVGARQYGYLDIPVQRYGAYLSDEDRSAAHRICAELPSAALREFTYEGIAVGEHAHAGALRFFARGEIGEEPCGTQILRRYLEAAILTATMMRNLLARERVDICVLNHGIYTPQGIISAVCRKFGVKVVTWNPAYRKGCFIFSHGDTYHHTLLDEPLDVWQRIKWNGALEDELMRYLKSRWEGSQDWIWFHDRPEFDRSTIERELGIDFSRPTIGLLTNVVWDAQLHYPANAFPGMIDWIMATIEWFRSHPELQLVIRVHPAELRGTIPSRQLVQDEIARKFPTLPRNVYVIPPASRASTYVLMALCDSVIIYGTKTGVELTSMGLPTIVAGEAWIRGKGVTIDVSTAEQYRDVLGRLPLQARMDAASMRMARMYAYHFFFRRMIPLPFMKGRKGVPAYSPELSDLSDLDPGRHAGLDVICDGILDGKNFLFPAEELDFIHP